MEFNWTVFQENIGILGIQGSGKTTRCRNILDSIHNTPRLIISPQKPEINYAGYGTPINKVSEIEDGKAMLWIGDTSKSTFESICKIVMARCSNMVIVVDDVQEFCTKQKMNPNFNRMIQSGRNRGICGIYLSPSPNLVHNYILQSCQHILSFRMTLESQIEWLEKNFYGNDAQILLPADRRNPKKPTTIDCQYDILPKYSFLYRFYEDTETSLFIGETT